jgi:hypothetical protein
VGGREGGREGGGEQPAPAAGRHALAGVDLDPEEPAAGRVLLEDDPVQVLGRQLADPLAGPGVHRRRPVDGRARGDHARRHDPRLIGVALQAHRFARGAHADFDLRADRYQLAPGGQGAGQPAVVLVAAVEAHFLPQQAGTDADAQAGRGGVGVVFRGAGFGGGHGPLPLDGSKLAECGHS